MPVTDLMPPAQSNNELARILVESSVCDQDVIEQIKALQVERGISFLQAAKALNALSEGDLRLALSRKLGLINPQFDNDSINQNLIACHDPENPYVHKLRMIRDELSLSWFSESRHALAISGAELGVGCSHVAANLAVVFAQQGRKVLLIDTDISQSKQSEMFSLAATEGVMDCLAGWSSIDETIVSIPYVQGLAVMPVGTVPEQSFEILNRKEFSEFVNYCCQLFEVVLIDTPASKDNASIRATAMCAGGAALVLKKNHTRFATVQTLQTQFGKMGISLVGTILTEY